MDDEEERCRKVGGEAASQSVPLATADRELGALVLWLVLSSDNWPKVRDQYFDAVFVRLIESSGKYALPGRSNKLVLRHRRSTFSFLNSTHPWHGPLPRATDEGYWSKFCASSGPGVA